MSSPQVSLQIIVRGCLAVKENRMEGRGGREEEVRGEKSLELFSDGPELATSPLLPTTCLSERHFCSHHFTSGNQGSRLKAQDVSGHGLGTVCMFAQGWISYCNHHSASPELTGTQLNMDVCTYMCTYLFNCQCLYYLVSICVVHVIVSEKGPCWKPMLDT